MFNIKIILKIIFLFFLSSNVFAENKVGYVDLEFILSNTNAGKTLFEKLELDETKKIKELKLKEENLKNEENKILASKNIISEDTLRVNIDNFKKKLQNYKSIKKTELDNLKKIRNDEILNFLNEINPIIKQYMTDNQISIIIDKKNIYIADKKFDFTNNLIELINKKIK